MEHREKRLRLDEGDNVVFNPDAKNPLSDLHSTAESIAEPSSVKGASSNTGASPETDSMQNTAIALTSGPLTTLDQSTWQGWAEIENDPVIFNIMLREWGVRGIQVNEVVPLDAIFDSSSTSTYGLIFLSRYNSNKDKRDSDIPHGLWFANQTSTFSCATVALMNIVSNIENINPGPEVTKFISATSEMSSKDKGLALDTFQHVRKVHNSFATLIDMKSVDRRLREDAKTFTQRQKQAAARKRRPKPSKRGKKYTLSDSDAAEQADNANNEDEDDSPPAYHFTAYLPLQNHLWRLDGLQRMPEDLGPIPPSSHNWLNMAATELSAQWQSAAENELEFSLLSLVATEDTSDGRRREEENIQAARMREDWGPALAELVAGIAAEGRL